MIIDLASLGKNPKPIEHTFDAGEIELSEGTRVIGTAEFTGEARRDDVRTEVRGHISTSVASDCVRCLEPVERPVEVDFDDVFIDAENEPTDDEVQVADADLDVSILTENSIDLADIVREQLILATDEPVLCKEDCQGLCPQCGGNRNLIDCKCASDEIDPRWAALKNLN
jgi:uncharacterized protein